MQYQYPPKAGPHEMAEEKAALALECEKRNYGPHPPIICLDREGGVLTEREAPDWDVDSLPVDARTNRAQNYYDAVRVAGSATLGLTFCAEVAEW